MITIYIVFYLIFIFVIQSSETLRCYSCQGEKQCGRTFVSNSIDNKIIDGNNLYDSCSITVNSNGSISRDLIPAHLCRSSSYQFCCNQDLCNSLPSPPLPAFTTLKCATESCVRIHHGSIIKSYQMGCFIVTSLANESTSQDLFCCNSPLCNEQLLLSGTGIRCYTCDSRITGLDSCSILNTSSSYIYNSRSSSRTESCAMIIGLAGKDLITGNDYPAFTIRTFIDNCVNQSLGNVTYGGALFQGRIDCCSTSLCILQTTISNHGLHLPRMIVFISIVCLGLVFVLTGITLAIYRFRLKKSPHLYSPCVSSDGTTVLFLPTH